MSSAPPRVTFVVPAYNYGRFLAQAVDSLLNQTFQDLHVIVIDDASTDNTPAIMERYASHPRVHSIRRERNKGHIAAHNEGIAMAQGEFVGLMAADDYALKANAVERQLACFEADPKVGMVYGAVMRVDGDGRPLHEHLPWSDNYIRTGEEEFARLLDGNYVQPSGALVRKAVHDRIGAYDPRLPHAGDWELWLRIAAAGYSIGYVADSLYAYRIHSTNMSHSKVPPSQANEELLLTIENAFAALPPTAPAELRARKAWALRHALYITAESDRGLGRTQRSWNALLDIARRSPGELLSTTFYRSVMKVGVQAAIGFDRYVRLSNWRRGPAAIAN